MGTTHIEINHVRSRSPSVQSAPDEDDLHENGVQVSPAETSSPFSVIQPQSHSGSSSHRGEYVHLQYPHELNEGDDLHPSDSASRLGSREARPAPISRGNSVRRTQSGHRAVPIDPRQGLDSPTESGDSTEEFLQRPDPSGMPRPQSYYGPNGGYTHSSSSGSYHPYPPGQMVPIQPQPPPPHPYPHPYPPMQSPPPPMGYPPSQMTYPGYPQPPHSQVSSPYTQPPYGPAQVMQYGGPTSGYFPPQYAPQYPPQQYHPGFMSPYQPPIIPPMNPYQPVDAYRVQSPAQSHASTAQASDKSAAVDQEAIIKRFEAMMRAQNDERKASEVERDTAMKQAAAQVKAEAQAAADRAAIENRIREEARVEAIKAYEEKAKAAADQAVREQQIRKEAAEAAVKAAEEVAKAKTDRAAHEKKLADDAAAAAKSAAEKEAAEAAAKVKEESQKAQEEAEKKLKEAEEAAAKAKTEAEESEKKAAAAAPPEKRAPVRFKDAAGRNYNFPFERCCKWRDMEGLINQAFANMQDVAEQVYNGHYDLLGPDREIIMPQYWDSTVEPDMHVTMMLWPEKKEIDDTEIIMPVGDDGDDAMNLDDILGGGTSRRNRGGRDRGDRDDKKPRRGNSKGPGAVGRWMLGGAPRAKKR